MNDAVVQSLPIALGLLVASTPVVVLAVVLVTKRPPGTSGAFLAGWVAGLVTAGALVLLLADLALLADASGIWTNVLAVVLGVLLLVMAVRKWRGRPRRGDAPKVPPWMAAIDTMTAARAFGLAFLLGSVNPKNVVLVAAGATVIAEATPVVIQQLAALAVFAVVGSLGVAAPLLTRVLFGSRSQPVLDAADRWMTRYSAVVMAVVLAVLGALMVLNGLDVL